MKLLLGDCKNKLKELEDNSIDAIVTDPPYGLSFMGKKWDYDVPQVEVWKECLRVLKPGGHALVACGTRTQHRMAVNIEDAGFEIRDMIAWVYGSGFPKSLNIGKAVDKIAPRLNQFDEFAKHLTNQIQISGKTQKEIASLFPSKTGGLTGCVWNWANGANVPTVAQWNILKPLLNLSDEFMPLIERIEREREVVGKTNTNLTVYQNIGGTNVSGEVKITKGTSQWEGWGTALKPAMELWTLCRKPLEEKTVAENCLKWGVGGINIDGCRVQTEENTGRPCGTKRDVYGGFDQVMTTEGNPAGRFPANLIHDGSDEVVGLFPQTKSPRTYTRGSDVVDSNINWNPKLQGSEQLGFGDSGSAARFFYCAKASKRERNIGCEGLPLKSGGSNAKGYTEDVAKGLDKNRPVANFHPTVKPVALMRYLCRLITPKGGVILDPYMGSGTTGIGAKLEGFDFIGIEREEEYIKIAKARIEGTDRDKPKEQLNLV